MRKEDDSPNFSGSVFRLNEEKCGPKKIKQLKQLCAQAETNTDWILIWNAIRESNCTKCFMKLFRDRVYRKKGMFDVNKFSEWMYIFRFTNGALESYALRWAVRKKETIEHHVELLGINYKTLNMHSSMRARIYKDLLELLLKKRHMILYVLRALSLRQRMYLKKRLGTG